MTPADRAGPVDDAGLVDAARRGDRAALEQLLGLHFDRVRALCRKVMANDADTDDATQEALLAICRGIGRFDGRSAFGTWIYRVTTNACLDELRRKGRRPIAMDADTMPAKTVPDGFADDIADRLEIDDALAQLTPDFRAAVVLRDLCQLDYDEIAEVLDIPPGTVRSRIARGRAQLARFVETPRSEDPVPRSKGRSGLVPRSKGRSGLVPRSKGRSGPAGNQFTARDRPKQSE